MNCSDIWSIDHYSPFDKKAEIIVDRIAPKETSAIFTWSGGEGGWTLYLRAKGSEDEWTIYRFEESRCEISGLEENKDYEFFIESGVLKSEIGYVRTGYVPGAVVNYLHPDDMKYAFSGRHLCTPSLLVHHDGYLLASMDIYEGGLPFGR